MPVEFDRGRWYYGFMSKKHRWSRNKALKKPGLRKSDAHAASIRAAKPSSHLSITLFAVVLLVVCVLILAVHWPALSCQALSFDDHQYLTENKLVRNPGWDSTRRFLTEVLEPSSVEGYYQPLTMISLMIDYTLGGRPDNLAAFHRTSLIIHLANTCLVIILLYLLFGSLWAAVAAGLLFGVHPMTVESISWVCDRKTLLAAFFSLWALVFYVQYAHKKGRGFFVGSLLMYLLALLAKPTSTPLPAVLLLLDFWPLKKLSWRLIIEKVPFFVVGGAMAVITVISQSRTADLVPSAGYGPESIPLVLCHNIIFYLYKIVWPINLSSHYAFPEPLSAAHPMVLAGMLGTCILIFALLFSLRWTRGAFTGWLIFFVAIMPAMQVLRFSNVIASDKFAYLPSTGLLIALAAFLIWFCGTDKSRYASVKRYIVIFIVVILAGAESVATRRYLVHWRNTIGLYEHMLSFTPNSALLHYNLGTELQALRRDNEAISHYRQAVTHKPDYAEAHYNIGNTLKSQQKLEQAIYHYQQAVEFKPRFAEALTNMGNALSMQGKSGEAISCYRRALALKDDYPQAHSNLGWELKESGQSKAALEHFAKALALDPDLMPALFGMGWILATNPESNLRDAEQAIVLAERGVELTNNRGAIEVDLLAIAYAAAGQFDLAVTTGEKAVALALANDAGQLANNISKRLELYRQSKPHRQAVRKKPALAN